MGSNHVSSSARGGRQVVAAAALGLIAAFAGVPAASAGTGALSIRHALVPQQTRALTDKVGSGPLEVQAILRAAGVGLAAVGAAPEETVVVRLDASSIGQPASGRFIGTHTVTFGDGSTLVLDLDGSNDGKKFTASIVGASGTGRFADVSASGTLSGDVYSPKLSHVVVQATYTAP